MENEISDETQLIIASNLTVASYLRMLVKPENYDKEFPSDGDPVFRKFQSLFAHFSDLKGQ